jgi:serine/threonine protein kinase/Tol biopolymer transport system component
MALTPGTRIGPYEITGAIGAGGMGEVYRAHDSRLHRDVAIKVLPELVARDPERLARFEREAQVLASLNHPYIAHIHGVEESQGALALVMELVEGETLAERIARGPVPLDEAVPVARQIAEALEAAHDRGIVHRDLKPANIKVRPDGTVKVLDFGLAKALDASGSLSGIDAMNSPTLTVRGATAAGVILGTAAYMSPEQARGKSADARSDIWAFGAVLYEMLTGQPLFAGATVSDVLAAVLRDGPKWDALPAETPSSIRRLLRRCLQKDPQLRIRHAGDIRLDLLDASEPSDAAMPAAAPKEKKKSTASAIVIPIAAALAGAILTPIVASYFQNPPRPPVRKWTIAKESSEAAFGRDNAPAISPDGSRVAYPDGERIRIRDLGSLDPRVIPGTGLAGLPTWSPDGKSVLYFIDHKSLWKVAVDGDKPEKICNLPPGVVFGLAWRPDNTIVINMAYGPTAGELFTVPADGGQPVKATSPDLAGGANFFLRGHADGTLTYVRGNPAGRETLYVEPGKAAKVLALPQHTGVVVARSGHLLFSGGSLPGIWAVPFDRSSASITGEPFRVAEGGNFPTVSSDGTLAYGLSMAGSRQLWWVDRDGSFRTAIGQPQDDISYPVISPDGSRVAAVGSENGASSLWAHDVGRAAKSKLTFVPDDEPAWHPKENRLIFNRRWDLFTLSLDGASEPVSLLSTPIVQYRPRWSSDGQYLVFGQFGPKTQGDIWFYEPGAKEPKEFLASPFNEWEHWLSPDGKYIVYASDESGTSEIYVRAFPTGQGKRQLSSGGGRYPTWSAKGDEIVYVEGHTLMSAAVRTQPALQFDAPRALFALEPRAAAERIYDTVDGQRFAVVRTLKAPVQGVAIVQSWLSEFRKRR